MSKKDLFEQASSESDKAIESRLETHEKWNKIKKNENFTKNNALQIIKRHIRNEIIDNLPRNYRSGMSAKRHYKHNRYNLIVDFSRFKTPTNIFNLFSEPTAYMSWSIELDLSEFGKIRFLCRDTNGFTHFHSMNFDKGKWFDYNHNLSDLLRFLDDQALYWLKNARVDFKSLS